LATQFVAFAPLDRDRFFRQYYFGIRIQSHYMGLSGSQRKRPPHIFDLSFGRNEAVTGGRLSGVVARVESFYALPFSDRFVYMFGSSIMRLQRDPGTTNSLILDRMTNNNEAGRPAFVTIADPNVTLIALPAATRDIWRVGIGVDFVSALRSWLDAGKPKE